MSIPPIHNQRLIMICPDTQDVTTAAEVQNDFFVIRSEDILKRLDRGVGIEIPLDYQSSFGEYVSLEDPDHSRFIHAFKQFVVPYLPPNYKWVDYSSRELDYQSRRVDYLSREVDYPMRRADYPGRELDYPTRRVDYPGRELDYQSRRVDCLSREVDYPMRRADYPSRELDSPMFLHEKLKQENEKLKQENEKLKQENEKLKQDNHRLKTAYSDGHMQWRTLLETELVKVNKGLDWVRKFED